MYTSSKRITRYTKVAIFIHWFNALCWFFLLATGLSLLKNDTLKWVAGRWTDPVQAIFGGQERLLVIHQACGITWAGVLILFGVFGARRYTGPFLKRIFGYSFSKDTIWLVKKSVRTTLGDELIRRFGFSSKMPDQGFFNAGQKLFAVATVLAGTLIVISGTIMLLSKMCLMNTAIVQWSMFVHFLSTEIITAGLLVHIFMAAICRDMRPAFMAMFTGSVPEDYAKRHHRQWYLERRNTFRKKTHLTGTYTVSDGRVKRRMIVKDLSCAGLKFELARLENFTIGDESLVEFNLDGKYKTTVIRKRVTIKHISGLHAGAAFCSGETGFLLDRAYDRVIECYLLV